MDRLSYGIDGYGSGREGPNFRRVKNDEIRNSRSWYEIVDIYLDGDLQYLHDFRVLKKTSKTGF